MMKFSRREFFEKGGLFLVSLFALGYKDKGGTEVFANFIKDEPIPTRILGKTGMNVTSFFDTAPAYAQSQDYYGEALQGRRDKIFLASKTHERTRSGSLRLLEDSLKRSRTDHLDLWQFHDLRTKDDLDEIFSKDGALKAAQEAKAQGLIRFIGITGHHDPWILLVKDTVIPEAIKQNMGIIGMKVLARGYLLREDGIKTAKEAIGYVLNLPVSVVIIGCRSPQEVEENVHIAKTFQVLFLKNNCNWMERRPLMSAKIMYAN